MTQNILAPSVGESITEVSLLKWHKRTGEAVKAGELLLEIESDKATVEIVAELAGVLNILKQEGERVTVGEVIANISEGGLASAPTSGAASSSLEKQLPKKQTLDNIQADDKAQAGPAARKLADELGIKLGEVPGSGKEGRVTKGDLLNQPTPHREQSSPQGLQSEVASPSLPSSERPGERRVRMSALRLKIAERLVQAQHTAAILTTFNEVDMSAVMTLRTQEKEGFKARHGVNLGFMSFFTRASVESLKLFPMINATMDGKDILYRESYDIGIAVGTEKGLVVPVVRGAEQYNLAGIEKKIAELAVKARNAKLSIAEMSGGSFTITNGGVYGSLLSTPILNPPQSGILGMHKIQDRPVAIDGTVQIRPMMYLALSYDHRIIDGKEAVGFLVSLKDLLEHPEKMRLEF